MRYKSRVAKIIYLPGTRNLCYNRDTYPTKFELKISYLNIRIIEKQGLQVLASNKCMTLQPRHIIAIQPQLCGIHWQLWWQCADICCGTLNNIARPSGIVIATAWAGTRHFTVASVVVATFTQCKTMGLSENYS